MAPRMAAVLRAPRKLCRFSYVLFVFLLFYVLDVVSITVYDRDTLLNIGSSVAQRKLCSPDLEFHMLLCRPFWLPREFTAIIITAVYIPPQANTDQALRELYGNISDQETAHPDAAFVITGDFNKANFRTIAPKYFQHITINTRGDRVLDHCYSPFRDAYKSLPRPPFGKSDHSSVLLLPAYRQKLKREAPALRTINAGRTNRTLYYRTVLITWTGTCSGQRLMTT